MDGGAWQAAVHGVAKSRTHLSDFPFTFHFHALEKEMATHSSILAWRIPGTGEPGGLPSMGSHRVGHDCSDLAVAEGLVGGVREDELGVWEFSCSSVTKACLCNPMLCRPQAPLFMEYWSGLLFPSSICTQFYMPPPPSISNEKYYQNPMFGSCFNIFFYLKNG